MSTRSPSRFVRFLYVVFLGICSISCAAERRGLRDPIDPLQAKALSDFEARRYNAIVVMPLLSALGADIEERQLQRLTAELVAALERETDMNVVNLEKPEKVEALMASLSPSPQRIFETAARFGRGLDAQVVLCGVVTKYRPQGPDVTRRDRQNAAGFRLWLLEPEEDEILWTAGYENENRPLSENLFRMRYAMKEGMRFRSSFQLMQEGFRRVGETLSRLREEADRQTTPSATTGEE